MADIAAPDTKTSSEIVVYFTIGRRGKQEAAVFFEDTPSEEVKDLFRSAAEAGPRDILKLWDSTDRLLNISPRLEANTPTSRYTLEVVAAHCNGMLLDELGVDLRSLEDRVAQLEKRLRGEVDELPPSVRELKDQVDKFRTKLETTEHLSWLGFHNDFPTASSAVTTSRRLQYRRKSSTVKKRVRDKFFSICDLAISEEVRHGIRRPSFDSCQWEDEEVLVLLQQMFVDLELPARFNIELSVLRNFLVEVYDHYNEVPFHNFRHCFCVAQMMYAMIWCIDLPSKIGYQETLILLTACICHDLDHPGYNNIYQINAGTELALRYNDISPLENHHCSVAFRLLGKPECNFLRCLNYSDFRAVREGIIRCILATDMARHNEILEQFREVTHEFDYRNKAHINLLEMVLIKVADISNEARPMDVAEPWLDRLLQEFFKQSDAEKLEGLPVTPFMDRDKITKPSSQVGFIGLVLLPLFEALGELFTDLQEMIVIPVRDALEYYRRLNDAERLHRKSVIDCGVSGDNPSHLIKSLSVQFRRSFQTDIDEDPESPVDPSENGDDDEEDTVTEVEHSEKASTFKISTDGGRKSYPGSRKGSRDRQDQEYSKLMHSRLTSPTALSSEEDEVTLKEANTEDLKVLKHALAETIWEMNGEAKEVGEKKGEEVGVLERLKEEGKVIGNLQRSIGDLRPTSGGDVKTEVAGINRLTDKTDMTLGASVARTSGQTAHVRTLPKASDESPRASLATSEDLCNCDINEESLVENQLKSAPELSPEKKDKRSDPANQKSISLLHRFRHLTDRLSFNQSVDKEATSSSENSTPKRVVKNDALQFDHRATTLPKSRRRRGWRSLIGAGKSRSPSSSPLERSPATEKKNGNSRKNSSEPHSLAQHGAGGSRLSGSLDSALNQEMKENNNRKKLGSPGFLGRGSWMYSLAASFRSRRGHHQESGDDWDK